MKFKGDKKMPWKVVKCSQCGAKIDIDEAKKGGICRSCGSVFELESAGGAAEFEPYKARDDEYFYYDAVISKAEFKRYVYTLLSVHPDTPIDILQAQFEKPEFYIGEKWKIGEEHRLTWSASIGYRREEHYVEYVEKKFEVNGSPYFEKVPENKTRIVTDWNPASGEFACATQLMVDICPGDRFHAFNKPQPLCGDTVCGLSVDRERELTGEEAEELSRLTFREIERQWTKTAQGDTQKDFSCQGKSYNRCVTRYYYPVYGMNYTYGNQVYDFHRSAARELIDPLSGEPSVDQPNVPQETFSKAHAKQSVKKWNVGMAAAWIATVGILFAMGLSGIVFLAIPFILLLPISIFLTVKRFLKYKQFIRDAKNFALIEKKARLEAFLSQNHI